MIACTVLATICLIQNIKKTQKKINYIALVKKMNYNTLNKIIYLNYLKL